MKPPVFGFALRHPYEDEEIDVLRIRLWNSQNATAVLSDFHSAARVLAAWAQCGGSGGVRFEVSFVDGYVLDGCHEFFKKGKRRCSFSAHLRRMMTGMTGEDDFSHLLPARDASRYVIPAC